MAVYSRRLWSPQEPATGAGTIVYTCPSGIVAVVKSIHVIDTGNTAGAWTFRGSIGADTAGNRFFHYDVTAINDSDRTHIFGPLFVTLVAGEIITLRRGANTGGVVSGFGYELDVTP